jgi:hypothetical protein
MKGAIVHKAPRFGLPKATVTFTVGERGMPPGSGIPRGSVISVLVSGKSGRPELQMVKAYGRGGRYTAKIYVPPGGIGSIQVGGFLDVRSGSSAANGDFWIPVTFDRRDF